MTLTRGLCERIVATRYETLGARCIERTRQAIKDGVAVALAGSLEAPVRLLAEHFRSLGGRPQATMSGRTAGKPEATVSGPGPANPARPGGTTNGYNPGQDVC